jgi:ATP-binding cassette subfamily F protein uup
LLPLSTTIPPFASLMPLVTVRDLHVGFRGPALLDDVSCQIEAGQKIGLLGRNGAGKTTFMRLLRGDLEAESGEISFAPGTKVAFLPQEVPQDIHGIVRQVVAEGVSHHADGHETAWQAEHRVEHLLATMNLPGDAQFERLSSGMKRRAPSAVGSGARLLARFAAARRADEPSRHRGDHLARGFSRAVDWHADFRHARPRVSP